MRHSKYVILCAAKYITRNLRVQGRASFLVGDVDDGFVFDESREEMQLSVVDGQMQRSVAFVVGKIHVRTVNEKQRCQLNNGDRVISIIINVKKLHDNINDSTKATKTKQ